ATRHKRQQALNAKGKTARVQVTRTANGAYQAIIASPSTELRIETILILRVDLEDQTGIVAHAAPQREIQHNLFARNAALFNRRNKLSQFGERLRIEAIAVQQSMQFFEDGWRWA